jgi:hypothetical protein
MSTNFIRTGFIVMALMVVGLIANAQNILNKSMTIDVNRQRLADVLEIMSNRGNFYFSYNSSVIKKDSLVSVTASGKTVREILNSILPQGL